MCTCTCDCSCDRLFAAGALIRQLPDGDGLCYIERWETTEHLVAGGWFKPKRYREEHVPVYRLVPFPEPFVQELIEDYGGYLATGGAACQFESKADVVRWREEVLGKTLDAPKPPSRPTDEDGTYGQFE